MAISPTVSFSNLRSTVSQTGKTTNVIKNTLESSILKKRNLWNITKIFKIRRDEFERRQSQKDLLFAPSILRRRGGARLLSQQDKSTSITDRLLGFVKYLTAGWLLGNLPTWINYGEQFVGRLGTAGAIMSNYGDETLKVMKSIGSIFKSALKNLSAFDFSDRSGLMQNSITELTDALDDLGTGLSDALGVLFAPFKELPKEPKDEEQPTTPTPPGTPAPSGGNPDYWTLVAITALEESDPQGRADVAQSIYNRAAAGVFPGGKNIRNIILAENGGQYQYQPVGRAVKEFHQIGDRESAIKAIMVADKVSRKTAEQMIDNTASAINNPTLRKNAAEFIENRTDFRGKNLKVDKPSSTLPRRRTPNDNIFGNFVGPASYEYGRKTSGKSSPVPNFGVTQTPTPQSPTPTSLRNFSPVSGTSGRSMGNRKVSLPYSPTRPGSDVVITSVMGRRNGREHTGWDLAGKSGTPLYAYFPGVVTHENRASGSGPDHGAGYGYWVIWKDDVYGSYHFFGHLLKPAELRKGQRFQQGALLGYIGNTGRSRGPHLHWEISNSAPEANGQFTSRQDVNSWLKSHPLKAAQSAQISSTAVPTTPLVPADPKPSASLVSADPKLSAPEPSAPLVPESPQISVKPEEAVEMQNNSYQMGLREGIVQERRGQKVVIIDDRGIQIPQKVMTSSGDTLSIQIDESALLNTFMKNKLLLDLNYV